ncbi:hypothetical protein FOC1_g10013795, partial [Fusarium oxysporum f. sp. cubense race 1]
YARDTSCSKPSGRRGVTATDVCLSIFLIVPDGRTSHFSRIGSLSIVSLHDPTIMIHDLSVDPPNACHSNLEAPLKTVPSCPSQLYLTFPCTTVLALQC